MAEFANSAIFCSPSQWAGVLGALAQTLSLARGPADVYFPSGTVAWSPVRALGVRLWALLSRVALRPA